MSHDFMFLGSFVNGEFSESYKSILLDTLTGNFWLFRELSASRPDGKKFTEEIRYYPDGKWASGLSPVSYKLNPVSTDDFIDWGSPE